MTKDILSSIWYYCVGFSQMLRKKINVFKWAWITWFENPQIFKCRQELHSVSQAKPLNLLIPQTHTFKITFLMCETGHWRRNIRISGSNKTQAAHWNICWITVGYKRCTIAQDWKSAVTQTSSEKKKRKENHKVY